MENKLETGVGTPLATVDSALFRRVCGRFPTGITVITVRDAEGHPHGVTINSFSSLSLQPQLVMVCLDLRSGVLGHFLESTHFAINILGEHQEGHSRRFASISESRFHGIDWHEAESGVPLLDGSLAQLECAMTRWFEAGDHVVLIGEVLRAGYREGKPLIYFASNYATLL
jgi:flavin reductase (DIM6/NTAB) family NADH-FMN oxidoreductase RutF